MKSPNIPYSSLIRLTLIRAHASRVRVLRAMHQARPPVMPLAQAQVSFLWDELSSNMAILEFDLTRLHPYCEFQGISCLLVLMFLQGGLIPSIKYLDRCSFNFFFSVSNKSQVWNFSLTVFPPIPPKASFLQNKKTQSNVIVLGPDSDSAKLLSQRSVGRICRTVL